LGRYHLDKINLSEPVLYDVEKVQWERDFRGKKTFMNTFIIIDVPETTTAQTKKINKLYITLG